MRSKIWAAVILGCVVSQVAVNISQMGVNAGLLKSQEVQGRAVLSLNETHGDAIHNLSQRLSKLEQAPRGQAHVPPQPTMTARPPADKAMRFGPAPAFQSSE